MVAYTGDEMVEEPQFARRRPKRSEIVARTIAAEIFDNDTTPGTVLPSEKTMLERFGVSRGTLREAMRILEIQGLVTMKVGFEGGPVVAAMSPLEFGRASILHFNALSATYRDVWNARLMIEPLMARAAADNASAEQAKTLHRAMDPVDDRPPTHPDRHVNASAEFHRALCGVSGNAVLDLFAGALAEVSIARFPLTVETSDRWRKRVLREHRAIADAVSAGDGDEAERLMRAHMTGVLANWSKHYPAILDETVSVRHDVR